MSSEISEIKISEVEFIPIKPKSGLIGFCALNFGGWLYLASLAVYTRLGGGVRVVWPTVRSGSQQHPTVYPINKDIAQKIEMAIAQKVTPLIDLSNEEVLP